MPTTRVGPQVYKWECSVGIKVLKNLQPRLTIVAIAHKLSTLVNSDRIIYVAEGRIEAQGTFKEVLKNHAGFIRQIKTLKN